MTGTRTNFEAHHTTFDFWNVPVFYTPVAAGSMTENSVLRSINIGSNSGFGIGLTTEWGFFESLGRVPPAGTDMSYKLDYFSERGPAVGFNGSYTGGFIDQLTLNPWSYSGDFTSYLVFDHGEDDLGKERINVQPDDELRGRFFWEHQHFFPDDWQAQISVGYITDPTFLEEWFSREFRTARPQETSLYLKRQRDSEAITFLVSTQLTDFATVSDLYQEQLEVERLPELSYRRIGDSFAGDGGTFFSANTLSVLTFNNSSASLEDLGFAPALVGRQSPGIPSIGTTGSPEDTTLRGDFRQEVDFPFSMARLRMVPYVVGRYTAYNGSVDGSNAERLYAAAGIRMTTAFWKVDDTVRSELLDLNRLRHVIEPQLNLYAGAQSADRNELLIYDEPIDAINDISAVQLALNQRWQTKRGGPGRWRSVDAFTFNIQGNYFLNQPPDAELDPTNFRGLYFVSMPEASIPRNGINADASWRVSDSAQLLSDLQFNTDEGELATASIGLQVHQEKRVSYYIGLRHVGINLNQVIGGNTFTFDDMDLVIFAADYQLTSDYQLSLANSYDLAQNRNDRSMVSLIRHFDRFYVSMSIRVDQFQNESAFMFNLWPEGLAPSSGSGGPARR